VGSASVANSSPTKERVDAQRIETAQPISVSTKATPKKPALIQPGEFEIKGKSMNGALYISLDNCKALAKTDYSIRVTGMEWYSPALEQGRGGFVPFDWFAARGGSKVLPTSNHNQLSHGSPQWFPLLRAPDKDGWKFVLSEQAVKLRQTQWRIFLELQWKGHILPMLAEIELKIEDGQSVATLRMQQGDDVPPRAV
jgi:hypothetical protein